MEVRAASNKFGLAGCHEALRPHPEVLGVILVWSTGSTGPDSAGRPLIGQATPLLKSIGNFHIPCTQPHSRQWVHGPGATRAVLEDAPCQKLPHARKCRTSGHARLSEADELLGHPLCAPGLPMLRRKRRALLSRRLLLSSALRSSGFAWLPLCRLLPSRPGHTPFGP